MFSQMSLPMLFIPIWDLTLKDIVSVILLAEIMRCLFHEVVNGILCIVFDIYI